MKNDKQTRMHGKPCSFLRIHLFRLMAVLFTVLMTSMPGQVWGANNDDDTEIIDGVSYHVLRTSADWDRFLQLVIDANGKSDVNAIMDGDFSTVYSVGFQQGIAYRGIFDGNGHTLNVNIQGGTASYVAPFSKVMNATFKNLHVTGSVKGARHASGLVGSSDGTEINIDNCRVSVNVESTDGYAGGFIGHGHKCDHSINNCLFDGMLTCSNYAGSIIGWEEGGTVNYVKNCLENGIYEKASHKGFCYNKSTCYGNTATNCKNNWSYMKWGEMDGNVVGSKSVADLVTTLGSKNWKVENGEAVPVMAIYPAKDDVSVEASDLFPGTEKGEEGIVKIPITSDKPILWIEGSYTNEDGVEVNMGRTELKKDSYVGFLSLPATEVHRNLTITVKHRVGLVKLTYDQKMDAVIHNPRQLRAEMMDDPSNELTDAGAVLLQWVTKEPEYKDVMDGDVFMVMRSLTGRMENMESIGSVDVNNMLSAYTFKDSTLISALEAADIDKTIGIPLVRYCVVRGSTQQLWGFDKNPAAAFVQPQLATLTLLEPTNAKAAWSDETERKVKVTWGYKKNDQSHNYVWDGRAEMKLEMQMFRRDGSRADSTVTVLTNEQIQAGEMEMTLNRSCVKYQMRMLVEGCTSPIGKGTGELFFVLNSVEDYNRYADHIHDHIHFPDKHYNQANAIMTSDISIQVIEGKDWIGFDEKAQMAGNFNGNGHTLTLTFSDLAQKNQEDLALFRYLTDGAVITNLNVKGKIKTGKQFAAGIASQVQHGMVFIENCQSSLSLETTITRADCATGGLVGRVGNDARLYMSNCLSNGEFGPGNAHVGGFGGFIGFMEPGAMTMITNSMESVRVLYGALDGNYGKCYTFARGENPYSIIVQDSRYKDPWNVNQGKRGTSAPDNPCWENGVPATVQKAFSTPVSGSTIVVSIPADGFFYENLGRIDKESLTATSLPTSVLLEWENETEEFVDYYEVWRRDVKEEKFTCIATQLSDMQYEDKKTSPVHKYEYFVCGVNDCEGETKDSTKTVVGFCVQTGSMEGYLCFADGTGIPGETINITSKDGKTWTATTDESGYFYMDKLPYVNEDETAYDVMPGLVGYQGGMRPVRFGVNPGDNIVKNVVFEVGQSVKFSGYVVYNGTSIPVQGVSFILDDKYEVRNASGKVVSDHEGKFAFYMLQDSNHKIKAVKDGHIFYQKGYYHEDEDTTKFDYQFTTDKAGIYFYDDTRVRLIGRVAGGKDQASIPLGNSLSRNNLGRDLEMVFTLEGDHASRLVWDIQDTKKKTMDEVFVHKAHDKKYTYQTTVHTTLNRKVVHPDVHTGEYEVLLPPVKWKVQQITAKGYATLFQDGQNGDVIDLTDSLTEHTEHYEGVWRNAEQVSIKSVDVTYHAQYNRIYHSPVLIDYQQIGFDKFSYFGERYYNAKNLMGDSEQVPLCYPVRKKDWPEGKKDSLVAVYPFGHPVFNIERNYPIKISAVEKYYFNNDTKNDTVDIVRLSGGEVTIHNSMVSTTHKDIVPLDSVGEAIYNLRAQQTPYLLTGEDAVRTVNFTLLMDGVHYEAEPLKAYVLNQHVKNGAKDILTINRPLLIDVLRDPPGGGSSAKLSKGSTLKYAHDYSYSVKAGLNIGIGIGNAATFLTAAGIGAIFGTISNAESKFSTDIDLVWTWTGKEAWSYTMTNNVDISTSSDKTMVGADADVYIGVETSYVMKPMVAIRAIPESMWKQLEGQRKAGRMVEIASGFDEKGDTLHLVRDEMVGVGPKINSTFAHSQTYILKQLIPQLQEQCRSLMFTGTKAEAQDIADATGTNVYWSLRTSDDPDFATVNTTKVVEMGDESWDYYFNTTKEKAEDGINYLVVRPSSNSSNTEDKVAEFNQSMLYWAAMIAQNEKEKLSATELVRSFDIDGGSPVGYSEEFSSDYSATGEVKNPLEGGVGKLLSGALSSLGRIISRFTKSQKKDNLPYFGTQVPGYNFKMSFGPVFEYSISDPSSTGKKYNRKESFTISMDKKSHLVFDVYRVQTKVDDPDTSNGKYDVFVNRNYTSWVNTVKDEVTHGTDLPYVGEVKASDLRFSKSFVYRTRGGATCRPYEGERTTNFYKAGTVLDERTKKIENPVIRMDKQSISGVPFGEPARFKLYLTNESEQPEAAYNFFDLYQVEKSNPKGAKLMVDGLPLTGNARTIEVRPGQVTEKTLEVYASEDFDYENLKISLISLGDVNIFNEAAFDVHYLQTAGAVTISMPGDKWIMNTDASYEDGRGWYLPVVIGGFNKNQHNFDHIEFQYKETTRGDDYWTNLCGYYADSTLYTAASGTKAMIPENGNIITRFFGEGVEMEKAYDLRAVLFCRNGNSFLTNASKVLTGVKDTRRPQLFGNPEPKDGVLGAGDNIIFNFSEDIEYNYLQATTNFEVKGETNESSIQEAPSLQFFGESYAQSEARRNFTDKDVTVEVMIKPDDTGIDMPIFSHGSDGKQLQLWLTKDKCLKAVVNGKTYQTETPIQTPGFQRVAMTLDNAAKTLSLFSVGLDSVFSDVTYSGYGPVIFGSTNETDVSKRSFYKGRMLQGRVWNRAMNINLLNNYGNQLLTGYEMGLTDYYPMNEGKGDYASDLAHGAHLKLYKTDWAKPRGMSLKFDWAEDKPVKGLKLKEEYFQRSSEYDYTLMFWFKTNVKGQGTLLCNGSGYATDVDAENKFFIGFEGETLKYRSNGREYELGNNFNDTKWHHYAMTVNRSHQVASIYVDNEMKAQFPTDSLGGMIGNFYLGNMVWQEQGIHDDVIHYQNALSGNIDGLALFEQALPPTLIKRYTDKSLGGEEKGLITYVDFERQERQKNGDLTLQPYVLNKKVKYDEKGNKTEQHDSVFVDPIADIEAYVDRNECAPMQAYEELKNLNFSYVGRDYQLLVNIDETDRRVNKRMVYVTVSDIPDLNGNIMASPATAAVFIDRNPLRWSQKVFKETIYDIGSEYEYQFDVDILNNSGSAHTYTIDNLPKWLTVNKQTDIIEAKSEQTLTFTIGKDTNVGTYDQLIYLTDENGLAEPLMLNITIEGENHQWYVDSQMMQFSMSIVARVKIGDDIVTDSRDVVGVFDKEGRCMGVGNVNYDPSSSESLAYLTVYDSLTLRRDLEFRLWHYETGKIMPLTPSQTVEFLPETLVGTTKKPLVLTAFNRYIQRIDLWPGWNWISLNVLNNDYRNVTKLLSSFQWKEGDMLTDETNNISLLYQYGQWISNKGSASLDDLRLSVSRSYRVKVGEYVRVDLEGTAVQADGDRLIRVKQGWNSIGYTPLVNLPVTTALADYLEDARDGDVVKNQTEFAMFSVGANGSREWKGNLKNMKPGEGYMLYRQNEGEATFTYPFFEATTPYFEQPASRKAPMIADFANTMSLTAIAEGVEWQQGDKLIAYSGAEMRGETQLADSIIYMSISGNKQTPLMFVLERDGHVVASTGEVIMYENNAVIGSFNQPTAINFVQSQTVPQEGWYTLQGIKLDTPPTQRGIYIHNGRRVAIMQ